MKAMNQNSKPIYFVYHVPGIKIGCTRHINRITSQTDFWEILAEFDNIEEASLFEIHAQLQYGYRKERNPYHLWTSVDHTAGGKISGVIVSNREHTCPTCGMTGKGNAMVGHINRHKQN